MGCSGNNEEYYLGDSQTYKGITITVNSITQGDYYVSSLNDKIDAEDGRKFITLTVTIKNEGKSELSFYSSEFLLIESVNNSEEKAVNFLLDNTLIDEKIGPYESITGVVRFYVSETFAEKSPFILRYTYTDYDVAILWEEIEFEWILTEPAN